ncbi:MAG TPA: AI-2E family transporter [Polyangia bacterium]|nr:AI-2E family transporter [Polyangia bacterium]
MSSLERRSIEIPARTVLVAAACVGAVWLLVRLWPVLLVVAASLILVGTLNPIVGALQARGLRRGAAVAATLLTLAAVFAGLALVTAPALWAELGRFVHELPHLQGRVATWLERSAFTTPLAESIRQADPGKLFVSSGREVFELSSRFGARAGYAATTVALAVYMLLDPERSQGALYAIVPRQYHVRLARVLLGLETIVGGYVRGQLITSAAIGAYVFALLTLFHMPNALAFGVFAALADVLPLVGGALTIVPIALVALPHGMPLTVTLVSLVILYQELENRIIAPRVYGRVLRLDAVAVTIALLVGGQLGGVLGALLALPIASGLRMIVEELRVELPGQPGDAADPRARDEQRAEETYEALTAGAPAQEAAVVAVAIADEIRKRGHTPAPRAVSMPAKP